MDAKMPLSAFAAERRAAALLLLGPRRQPLSMDICCRHGAQQQTAVRPCCGRVIGQTDRQTDAPPLHKARSAYYAGDANVHSDFIIAA